MAKKFLISEEDATALLDHLASQPYRDVFPFCDVLRNLDEQHDFSDQLSKYHDFIVDRNLWDQFLKYTRWVHGMQDLEEFPVSAPLQAEHSNKPDHDTQE